MNKITKAGFAGVASLSLILSIMSKPGHTDGTRNALAHVRANARHSLTASARKTIHEATRIWCDFVDRSWVIR